MNTARHIIKYVLIFLLVLCMLFALLVGSALIPREAVKPKILESAEYMCENTTLYLLTDFLQASKIDHYADCITLSIAYYLDENNPVESALWSSYYGMNSNIMNHYLLESVINDDVSPNQEYLRYWHGSAGLIRFLHLFWNIKTIYIFHAVLMAGLYILLLYLLIKKGMLPEAWAFTFSMIIISVWYVPLCLEYTWMFLVTFVAALIAIYLSLKQQYKSIGVFFLITGMVAAYLDFLTTETLTLLIPLLFILRIRSRQGDGENLKLTIKSCFLWSAGFVGMWVSKWTLASVFLNQNVMHYVTGHVDERLSGKIANMQGNYILSATIKNLKCLFPYEYGFSGAVLIFVFIIVVVIIPVMKDKVVLRQSINQSMIPIYAVLALLPFIRFAVLRNHSYIHCFFTHRALASSVLALCFIVLELVQLNPRKAVMKNAKPHHPDALPE